MLPNFVWKSKCSLCFQVFRIRSKFEQIVENSEKFSNECSFFLILCLLSLSLPISPPVANFLYLFPINQSKVAINLSVVVVKYVPINGNVLLAPQQNCLPRKIAVIRLTLIVSFSKLLSANIKLNRYRLYYFNSCVFWLGNSSKQAQNGLNTIKIPISKHMSSRMLIKFRVCESIG